MLVDHGHDAWTFFAPPARCWWSKEDCLVEVVDVVVVSMRQDQMSSGRVDETGPDEGVDD